MKILEAIERLQHIANMSHDPEELELVIPIFEPGAIGGTPSIHISSIYEGFDWDMGRVFIHTEHSLKVITDEEKRKNLDDKHKQDWEAYRAWQKEKKKTKKNEKD